MRTKPQALKRIKFLIEELQKAEARINKNDYYYANGHVNAVEENIEELSRFCVAKVLD